MCAQAAHSNACAWGACGAGALVVYLYRNKSLEKTNAQLQSIGTVMATNLLMGSIQETAVDNVGAHFSLLLMPQIAALEHCLKMWLTAPWAALPLCMRNIGYGHAPLRNAATQCCF
jgi:hypothetical protein